MIVHHYECDRCGKREPITFMGWPEQDERRTRLPRGWILVYLNDQLFSYCSSRCLAGAH